MKPSPTRARITTPEQLEKIITSIQQFGLVMFVLIDAMKTIIAGHGIWEAAKALGFKTIRCVSIEHLDEHEAEALALALNRLGETGADSDDAARGFRFDRARRSDLMPPTWEALI